MAIISAPSELFTLVNVFTVAPDDQKELLGHLAQVTEELIRHMPGFVSASFHLSHDGRRVVNYAQWRTEADFRAMHADARLKEHFDYCRAVSRPEPIFCDVAHTCDAEQPDGA
ncbi:antibiotic biosynthesis monooxygenase family protein [Streptomyces sp. HF10]|uniref:antibiotic biosynthesis monooxygenase family protein n=1 Tax=Streptomyces sp. HF10 TaxID=2692233 RepID=UPI001317CC86|nr:antibiotic biosynthesis monooxygenase family protein [Streptomyces sp. HF10]QHC28703.1 antibiotic biosynthesis monooxygenase [Streptomyces sp. HF10]